MKQSLVFALCLGALAAQAQSPSVFHVRLTTVPMDATMRATVAGAGTATATLAGSKLTVAGKFEGLKSPATTAQIHEGVATGVRGPVLLDINASHMTDGTLSGSVELNASQVEALRKGRLYVQIQSEKAPDGNLWGWLLP
jgi:hypothetical protein